MTYNNPENAALLAHIVSQVERNVEFLASQGYITNTDASQFLSKLPRSAVQNTTLSFPTPTPTPTPVRAPPAPRPTPPAAPPTVPTVPQARAIWAWNGQDDGDLSIQQGDIVEIVEETNAEWWTGKLNGRQGIFPASYVEKVAAPAGAAPAGGKPVYKPFRAALHGTDQPPPAEGATNSVGLQQAPGQAEKKGKYGDLKNTMAHSAAGGVGFGAGAAIGGGLVRAIF